MSHAVHDEPGLKMGMPLPNGKLAMWLFLVTEIMFFTALIGTYMTLGAVAALPLGLLGRRFGEGRVLAIGLLLMTAGSVHSALSAGPQGIGLGRAAAGVGAVAMIV